MKVNSKHSNLNPKVRDLLHESLSLFIFLGVFTLAASVAISALLFYLWSMEDHIGSLHFSTDYYVDIALFFLLVLVVVSSMNLLKAQRFMKVFFRKRDPIAYKNTMSYLGKFWKVQGVLLLIFLVHLTLLFVGFNRLGFQLSF